jgi:hypothetical protein
LPTADCKGDVVLYAQLVKKADSEYLRFNDIDMKITIGGYHVRLDNLFNGDKFLGNTLLAGLGKVTDMYVTNSIGLSSSEANRCTVEPLVKSQLMSREVHCG